MGGDGPRPLVMATHLIVDGYNLIGHDGGLRGDLESRRAVLIRRLALYQRRRGHRVTVVFDGGRAGWSSEQEARIDGIRVIYSREGEPADDVIARLAEAEGAAVVVVSSDRAVQSAVRAADGVALSCGEFERKLAEVGPADETRSVESDDKEAGDAVGWTKRTDKRGNPFRRSKSDRRKATKLKKL